MNLRYFILIIKFLSLFFVSPVFTAFVNESVPQKALDEYSKKVDEQAQVTKSLENTLNYRDRISAALNDAQIRETYLNKIITRDGKDIQLKTEKDVLDYLFSEQGIVMLKVADLKKQVEALKSSISELAQNYIKASSQYLLPQTELEQAISLVKQLPEPEKISPEQVVTISDSLETAVGDLTRSAVLESRRALISLAQGDKNYTTRETAAKSAQENASNALEKFDDFIAQNRKNNYKNGISPQPKTPILQQAFDFFKSIFLDFKARISRSPQARIESAWFEVKRANAALATQPGLSSVSISFLKQEYTRLSKLTARTTAETTRYTLLKSYLSSLDNFVKISSEPLAETINEAFRKNDASGKTLTDALVQGALDNYKAGDPDSFTKLVLEALPAAIYKEMISDAPASPYDTLGIGAEWRSMSTAEIQERYLKIRNPTVDQTKAFQNLMRNKLLYDARMEVASELARGAILERTSNEFTRQTTPDLSKALSDQMKADLKLAFQKEGDKGTYIEGLGPVGDVMLQHDIEITKRVLGASYDQLKKSLSPAELDKRISEYSQALPDDKMEQFNTDYFVFQNARQIYSDRVAQVLRAAFSELFTKQNFSDSEFFKILSDQLRPTGKFTNETVKKFGIERSAILVNMIFKAITGYDTVEYKLGFAYGDWAKSNWNSLSLDEIKARYNALSSEAKKELEPGYTTLTSDRLAYNTQLSIVMGVFDSIFARESVRVIVDQLNATL